MEHEAALRARIAQLEEELRDAYKILDDAVYVTSDEWMKVAQELQVSRTYAFMLTAMWRCWRRLQCGEYGLTAEQLAAMIPNDWTNKHRMDLEMRSRNCVKVHVSRLRKLLPGYLVPNRGDRWRGIRLTPEGFAKLDAILSA